MIRYILVMVSVNVRVFKHFIVFIVDSRAQQYLSLSQGAAISALVQMESVREREGER